MRFGRLVVIKQAEDYVRPDGRREAQWLCKCDCGNDVVVISTSLKRGLTKSCGCFMRERVYETHKKKINTIYLVNMELVIHIKAMNSILI